MISDKETRDYFIKFKNGDINALNIIAKEHINLVYHIVNKYNNIDYIDKEDLISLGLLGYTKALHSFNLNKNNKFTTFAYICITNELNMEIRKRRIITVSIDDDNFFNAIKCDIAEKFIYNIEDKQLNNFLVNCIGNLPELEQQIIKLYFGLGNYKRHTQAEIKCILNLSSQGLVSRKIKKSLSNIRKTLLENNYTFNDDDNSLTKK